MVAKGVDYYLYSDSDSIRTEVTGPKVGGIYGPEANFRQNNLQISSRNIRGAFSFTGTLKCWVRRGGVEVMHQFQDINSRTGAMGRGTMANMMNTPPRLGDPTVCWGFYKAGDGLYPSKLTNQCQFYAYVTRDQRRWMTELVARDPRIARGPFARFALPGAHDAGMNDMTTFNNIMKDPKLFAMLMSVVAFIPLIGALLVGLSRSLVPVAISNLAMTQKDKIGAMLDIGTRYFDFRPGTMHPKLKTFAPGALFHQHGVVPGYPYLAFLEEVLRWLDANPGEIVVVNINTQGFSDASMKPKRADLDRDLKAAIDKAQLSRPIGIGDMKSIALSYEELIRTNTRLLFIDHIDSTASAYDSWNGKAYATLRPAPIIGAFEGMQSVIPPGKDFTIMQMQATSTAMGSGIVLPSVFRATFASSPLMATKPGMDAATIPWLRANAAKRLPRDHLLVLLNDFIDNCTVETAVKLTEQRARD